MIKQLLSTQTLIGRYVLTRGEKKNDYLNIEHVSVVIFISHSRLSRSRRQSSLGEDYSSLFLCTEIFFLAISDTCTISTTFWLNRSHPPRFSTRFSVLSAAALLSRATLSKIRIEPNESIFFVIVFFPLIQLNFIVHIQYEKIIVSVKVVSGRDGVSQRKIFKKVISLSWVKAKKCFDDFYGKLKQKFMNKIRHGEESVCRVVNQVISKILSWWYLLTFNDDHRLKIIRN